MNSLRGHPLDMAVSLEEFAEYLGISVDVEVTQGQLANAIWLFLVDFYQADPTGETWENPKIGPHAMYTQFATAAQAHGIENPAESGPPCLTIDVWHPQGIQAMTQSFCLKNWIVEGTPWAGKGPKIEGWATPHCSGIGSNEFHEWLAQKVGQIPELGPVLGQVDNASRFSFDKTLSWLFRYFGVAISRRHLLLIMAFLAEMAAFLYTKEDSTPWGVAVGWAIRLESTPTKREILEQEQALQNTDPRQPTISLETLLNEALEEEKLTGQDAEIAKAALEFMALLRERRQ